MLATKELTAKPTILVRIPVIGDEGGTYEVTINSDGIPFCTCPVMRFQKGILSERKLCKHVHRVIAYILARY